jgi:hypothetical protein
MRASRIIAFHVTGRLADDGAIARSPEALRQAARIIKRHGEGRGLLAFRVADTHFHVLIACDRATAGMFARYASAALHRCLRLEVDFERARYRAVRSERHLFAALRYIFRQEEHHGSAFDPAHEGSSLPELLGLRVGGTVMNARVRRMLPRLRREMLLEWLAVGALDSARLDPAHLGDAACAAFGLTSLEGEHPAQCQARRAAAHVCLQIAPGEVHTLLRCSARSVRRYRRDPVTAAERRAVELQLRLRTLLHRNDGGVIG